MLLHGARVSCVGLGVDVPLPDIHFHTAGAVLANTGVRVGWGWLPALDVALAIDKFNIMGTLSIAIARAIVRSDFV